MMSRHACIRAVNRAFIGLPQQYHGKLFDQRWVYGSHLVKWQPDTWRVNSP